MFVGSHKPMRRRLSFFWPLSDGGRSSLALHTNQGVNSVPEAIRANCGAS